MVASHQYSLLQYPADWKGCNEPRASTKFRAKLKRIQIVHISYATRMWDMSYVTMWASAAANFDLYVLTFLQIAVNHTLQ